MDVLEHHHQIKPVIRDAQRILQGLAQDHVELLVEACKQLADEFLFAPEMIIEVAGADVHLVGDVDRGHIRLALVVEQFEADLDDAITCFHGLHSTRMRFLIPDDTVAASNRGQPYRLQTQFQEK